MSNPANEEQSPIPFIAHLDGLINELRARIVSALEQFDADAVHKSRVTTRRLKAAMDLFKEVLEKSHTKQLQKIARKLRRRLGPLRDADVMLQHLDDLKDESAALIGGCEWLRDRLIRGREKARAESRKETSASRVVSKLNAWDALRNDFICCQPAIPSLLAESMHAKLDEFIDQANQLRAKLNREDVNDSAGTRHDPHQLRIAGKSLRYTLELAEANGHELPAGVLKAFKKMQESLGTWHDFVVLAERAMHGCLDEELPLHEPIMQREVLKLIDHTMTRAQEELENFVRLWHEKGQEITQTIREAFVLTQPGIPPMQAESDVTELQTDRDPSDLSPASTPAVVSSTPPPVA